MKVTFWGVRGSIPVPGPTTVRYGGNTACVEISEEGDPYTVIIDAGSGIRPCGLDLVKRGIKKIYILISHTHWDHIHGFPFFTPLYIPGSKVTVFGPQHHEKTLEQIITQQMEYSYFPVPKYHLACKLGFRDLKVQDIIIEDYQVTSRFLNHPVFMLGYRLERKGKVILYTGDNEPYYNLFLYEDGDSEESRDDVQEVVDECNQRLVEFAQGADLLIADSQYAPQEYEAHRGWGHSTTFDCLTLAAKAGVKKLVLFHHEPTRDDAAQDVLLEMVRQEACYRGLADIEILAGQEGLVLDL